MSSFALMPIISQRITTSCRSSLQINLPALRLSVSDIHEFQNFRNRAKTNRSTRLCV